MATVAVDVGDLPQFDCTDASGLSPRWKRWFRAFELFATGKGVEKPEQMKALLLHKAGMRVQDIYFTLPEVDGNDDCYKKCVKVLNQYFTPESNIPYERHVFRNMRQSSTETMEQFVTRLRQQSETCEFGDLNSVDVQIRDQVIEKCHSNHLRRKFLERGTSLDLKKMRELARVFEDTERQASTMEGLNTEVNRLSIRGKFKTGQSQRGYSKVKCYCCGFEGHTHKDSNCPARGRKCRKCKGIGHFERCCKTKSKEDYRRNNHRGYKHKKTVNQVDTEREESEKDFSFSVSSDSEDYEGEITVVAGGVKLKMLIDSGTTCNIIDRNTWEHLKASGIKCTSKKETKNIYPYGSTKSLQVAGTFTCEVNCCGRDLETVEFTVMEGKGPSLLGRKTAIQLGVLKLGPHVNAVRTDDTTDKIKTDYKDCFQGFGKLNNFQLNIPVEADAQPIALPLRRIPYHLRDRLSKKLDELEDLDIIEKVEGPSSWVSPVVVVPKGDKDIRLCVDMRMANESVRRARHPIPTIDEVLQDFNQSKIFSKLDIKWAYHQIELSEDARDITTFITHKGLYRYKRLMFGISCAPEMYQKVLQQLLQNCDGAHNILDDIIVHAETEEEHDKRLRQVLDVIRDRGMTLNPDKCLFKMKKLEFMGHVLSDKGIGPTETKIKAVQEARAPESASEVRSFLGLVNFTARYIENLATVSEPLRRLTRKDEPFVWGSDQEKAFQELKDRLGSAETLAYFDKQAKTQVIADASPVGLGAVLVQLQGEEYRIISYASRSLTDVERRYSQTEKEALGLVWACERFHAYLYGAEFELLTDHKPLEFIYSPRSKPSARIERWVLRMQPYKYTVRHIPGKNNIADSLSRLLKVKNSTGHEKTEEYIKFVAREATPVALTTRDIERESDSDPELEEVRKCLLNGQWHKTDCKQFVPIRSELTAVGKLVLRGTRIIIPKSLRTQVLELAHEGHPGIVSMKQRLRTKVWWPGIDKEAERYCRTCYGCQLVAQASPPTPMSRTEMPSSPWQHVAADLLGPLPSGDYIFVVVDYYSRFFEIEIMKSTVSEKIVTVLSKIFLTHGLPVSIQTDNGPQFISEQFKKYMNDNGITHRKTTPLWPQANGEVERQNRSILKRIKIAQAEGRDWKAELDNYLIMYRSTPHSTTGRSPAELMYKRIIRTKIPQLQDYQHEDSEVRDRDNEKKGKGKDYADQRRRACESDIQNGDSVLVKQYRENKWSTPFNPTPFKVVGRKGNCVIIESPQGVEYRRNITAVKKFHDRGESVVNPPMEKCHDNGESVVSSPVRKYHESTVNNPGVDVQDRYESVVNFPMENCEKQSKSVIMSELDANRPVSSKSKSSRNSELSQSDSLPSRPVRVKRTPSKFDDFIVGYVEQ